MLGFVRLQGYFPFVCQYPCRHTSARFWGAILSMSFIALSRNQVLCHRDDIANRFVTTAFLRSVFASADHASQSCCTLPSFISSKDSVHCKYLPWILPRMIHVTPKYQTRLYRNLHPPIFQRGKHIYTNIISDKLMTRLQQHNHDRDQAVFLSSSPLDMAEEVMSILSQRTRTWKRFRHFVELACAGCDDDDGNNSADRHVIADIGCDHGLLSIALACTGKFHHVIGTDVSKRALTDGALYHYNIVKEFSSASRKLPLDFRVGNGLEALNDNDDNLSAICIAGMGVHTMLKIMFSNSKSNLIFHHKDVNHLYLQPTNSRPKNLILLYHTLQKNGWVLNDERIEYSSSRWYITSSFTRNKSSTNENKNQHDILFYPGDCLSKLPNDSKMKQCYNDYVKHHSSWLKNDLKQRGIISAEVSSWLERSKRT